MPRIYAKGVEIVPGFRLIHLLGRGGFGEVWKAAAPGGTDAAIKIISLGERYGFKEYRSIQIVKQLRHPNLVPILAFWLRNSEGQFFDQIMGDNTLARRAMDLELIIAMGLGQMNLLDRLQECQKEGKPGIPPDELLGYLQDSAKAIDYLNQSAHDLGEGSAGIQHCDIKPQNILIVGGAAQVCDFGLARVLGDSHVTSAKGSAAYMAPELILDNKPSKATDQYCLAISYVELRTGELPLNISSPAAAIWAHAQGKLDLSKLPLAEQIVIKKATSVSPDLRYPSNVEMVRALRQAVEKPSAFKSGIRSIITLDEMIKPGGEVVPGYKLLKLLGQGGYGQVWEAVAPGGKHVALKIIRNLEGTQGRQEFRALELIKGVEHNHLIELHAYWILDRKGNIIPDEIRHQPDSPDPSTLVIASKLASQNLHQRLKECLEQGLTGIPVPELMGYMKQAAQAVDYLNAPQHQLGDRKVSIQHRDIKPENILLASGVVKVGDFGLAKVVEGTQAVIHGDSAGLTLVYAAPEMFQSLVTNCSDQYSLSLTYFKLRTGVLPFPANSTPNDVIRCHLQGKLDLNRLPAEERAAIARATSVKPDGRYPNCATLVEELERACGDLLDYGPQSLPTLDYVPNLSSFRAEPGSSAASGLYPVKHMVANPETPTDIPEITSAEGKQKAQPSDVATLRVDQQPAARGAKGAKPAAALLAPDSTRSYQPESPEIPEKPKAPSSAEAAVPPASSPERRTSTIKKHVTAAWRESAAAKRRRKTQAAGIALIVAALLFVSMIGLALYAVREGFLRRTSPADRIKAEVVALIDEGKFDDAHRRMETGGLNSDVVKELHQSILRKWREKAEAELENTHDFEQAEMTAKALLVRYADDSKAKAIAYNAQFAKEFRTKIKTSADFSKLDQQLETKGGLWGSVQKQLRLELLEAKEPKRPKSSTVTPREVKEKQPERTVAAPRNEKPEEVRKAEEAVDRAALYLEVLKNPPIEEVKKHLRDAEQAVQGLATRSAEKPLDYYLLQGKIHELKDDPASALAAYGAQLANPADATREQLPLLLARVEFLLNRKWSGYVKGLRTNQRSIVLEKIKYADRAGELTKEPVEQCLRVRAVALQARSRFHAKNQAISWTEAEQRRFDEAATQLQEAIAIAKREPVEWQCLYEMARQLVALSEEYGYGGERDNYRKQAKDLLDMAKARAPQDEAGQRIQTLLNKLAEP